MDYTIPRTTWWRRPRGSSARARHTKRPTSARWLFPKRARPSSTSAMGRRPRRRSVPERPSPVCWVCPRTRFTKSSRASLSLNCARTALTFRYVYFDYSQRYQKDKTFPSFYELFQVEQYIIFFCFVQVFSLNSFCSIVRSKETLGFLFFLCTFLCLAIRCLWKHFSFVIHKRFFSSKICKNE